SKAVYAKADQRWSFSCLVFAWAGAVYGAAQRFDAWGIFLHQFNLWRFTEIPIIHAPFKWSWCGPAANVLGVLPAAVLLFKQTAAWRHSQEAGRVILVNAGIMVLSAVV